MIYSKYDHRGSELCLFFKIRRLIFLSSNFLEVFDLEQHDYTNYVYDFQDFTCSKKSSQVQTVLVQGPSRPEEPLMLDNSPQYQRL